MRLLAFLELYMRKTQGIVLEISERLFTEFQHALPLHPEKSRKGKKLTEREIAANSEAALKNFLKAARAERTRHRLGIIGRARVAFSLQQRLLAAGYAPALVKQVLFSMLAAAFVGGSR